MAEKAFDWILKGLLVLGLAGLIWTDTKFREEVATQFERHTSNMEIFRQSILQLDQNVRQVSMAVLGKPEEQDRPGWKSPIQRMMDAIKLVEYRTRSMASKAEVENVQLALSELHQKQLALESVQREIASRQDAAFSELNKTLERVGATQEEAMPVLRRVESNVETAPIVVSSVEALTSSVEDIALAQEVSPVIAPYLKETRHGFRYQVRGGIIRLTGTVPNERLRLNLRNSLTSAFGKDRVSDNLQVPGKPR